MKNNKIKIKAIFFIIALTFSYNSVIASNIIIKYIYDDNDIMLLNERHGYMHCYKVSAAINYLLLDKQQDNDNNVNLDTGIMPDNIASKEEKHITLLIPTKKKLLVDFNDCYIASKVTSENLSIKNIHCINNDCVSFLDLYQKIISIYAMKHKFKTVDASIACCNYIMHETLMALKKNNTLLFLPVLIPAITKLEKNRVLLPLAYIDSILYNSDNLNELIINLTVTKMHDKSSPTQEFSQGNYLNMIANKLSTKNRAQYKINLSTGSSTFDLITYDNFCINLKEKLMPVN